jgi:hypothetical protein
MYLGGTTKYMEQELIRELPPEPLHPNTVRQYRAIAYKLYRKVKAKIATPAERKKLRKLEARLGAKAQTFPRPGRPKRNA